MPGDRPDRPTKPAEPVLGYAGPRPDEPKPIVMAAWVSLVLGSFCVLLIPFLALSLGWRTENGPLALAGLCVAAVLVSALALWQTRQISRVHVERFARPRRGRLLVFLGLVGAGLGLLALAMQPRGNYANVWSTTRCVSHLRQIAQAAIQYTIDTDGVTPPNAETLVAEYDLFPEVFACPAGDEVAGLPLEVGTTSSYGLFLDQISSDFASASPDAVVGFCIHGHGSADDEGQPTQTIVLYADGSVRPTGYRELAKLLAQQMTAVESEKP
ncbi:MAG: hypothetical protein AAGI46_08140 [Planctomycetota bacterium]